MVARTNPTSNLPPVIKFQYCNGIPWGTSVHNTQKFKIKICIFTQYEYLSAPKSVISTELISTLQSTF